MSQNKKQPAKPPTPSFWAHQKDVARNLLTKAIILPIDLFKLVQQSKFLLPGSAGLSALQILKNRVSTNGFFSLWSAYPYTALKGFLIENLLFLLSPTLRPLIGHLFRKSYIGGMLPGAVPSIISQCLTQPLDTLATVSAVLAPAMSLSALLSSLSSRSTLQGAGFMTRAFPILSALFAGLPVTIVGALAYRVTYFILYDATKSFLDPVKDEKLRKFAVFFHGLSVTLCAATLTYPLDTIRRVQCLTSMQGQEMSALDAATMIWNTSGFMGFFAGDNANGIRSIVSACSILALGRLVK